MSDFVKKFQKKHGLTDDGIIGKNTFAKLKVILKLNDIQLAHFLGQTAHESGNFTVGYEDLRYSEKRILQIFPKYFTAAQAKEYAKNAVRIGSRAYANRMGNGNEASQEGYKYRGRGALQTTGKNLYRDLGKFLGVDLVNNPDLVAEEYYFESALYYFNVNNLWKLCTDISDQTILKISRAVNLGNPNSKATPNGLEDRIAKTKYYYKFK